MTADKIINVEEQIDEDFVGVTPTDTDLPGIGILLKQLFRSLNVDYKDLANLLVEQNYVTTALKLDSDDDPRSLSQVENLEPDTIWAVCSAVNIEKRSDYPSIKSLMTLICEKAAKKYGEPNIFLDTMDTNNKEQRTGFLIKEAIANMPGIGVAPMLVQLLEDLKTSTDSGMSYDFTHYIHMSKIIAVKPTGTTYYIDQIDEVMEKHCLGYFDIQFDGTIMDISMSYQTAEGVTRTGSMARRVFLITREQLDEILTELGDDKDVKALMDNVPTQSS